MPYAQDRLIHDAASHLMEWEDCLDDVFDPKLIQRHHDLPVYRHKVGNRRWSDTACAA